MTPLSGENADTPLERRRPTMKEVAALAGVGIKTVSRVINAEPNVSPATAERVMRAAAALDYHPDLYAGNLKRGDGRSRTLGLLLSSVGNPFDSQVHRAVERAAVARGVAVFAASNDEDPDQELAQLRAFAQRRVDGLIVTTTRGEQDHLVRERDRGVPVVFVDREPVGVKADVVCCDNLGGAAEATRHLLRHGHRRIAMLADLSRLPTSRTRQEGFLQEVRAAGLSAQDTPVLSDLHDERGAEEATRTILTQERPPTALFTARNQITVGAVRALQALGLQHQVALVGFDELELSDLVVPGITVIAQDPEQIGAVAAERLFQRLDGDHSPATTVTLPIRLVARGSGEIPAPAG